MWRCFAFFAGVLLISSCTSVAPEQREHVRKLAAERAAAFTSGHFAHVTDLTYPKFVEMDGGRKKETETLRSAVEYLKAHGGLKYSAEVGEPGRLVTVGDKQFAIVPVIVRIQVPKERSRFNTYFVAISEDRGKTWTFINGSALNDMAPGKERRTLTHLIPDFPAQLALPRWKPEVIEPK